MRTHSQIIVDGGGDSVVGPAVGAPAGNVKQWRRNDSIPAPYWRGLADNDFATLDELAAYAAAKKIAQGEAA